MTLQVDSERAQLNALVPTKFVQVDEEGYFMLDGLRVADADAGKLWLSHVVIDGRGRAWTDMNGEPIFVEAFDEPYIALDIEVPGAPEGAGKNPSLAWRVTMPYAHTETFLLTTLTLDEWDRFHGRTERGIPFVMSRSAQARFFNLVDEFDDDAITVGEQRIETKPWLIDNPDVDKPSWWTEKFQEDGAPWDLAGPSPVLPALIPQLKLQRSRILVLGAGAGHDAAWLAEQGHIVTAVDFSPEAITRAKQKYSHVSDLHFMQADVFQLPASMNSSFDIVFEHTLYCAIAPSKRPDLMKVWRRVLIDNGHILGVFEARDKAWGPPYGGSEWEVRSRLQKSFRMLYWMRFRGSAMTRAGQEFFVYAQRLTNF